MATAPTESQLQALLQGPPEGSIRMINLLKFKAIAEYEDGSDGGCANGMEAYMRYSEALHAGILEAAGATMIYSELISSGVIGDAAALDYDVIAIVNYPSRRAFLDMAASPAYQKVHVHRVAGLERQLLLCCEGNAPPLGSITS
ncbi:MAG: DUF1330 domain-containing protein [Halioglobus sp.]|nr:DUF1330 domain-containing protein [Halioglobus sp.]